jgi:hypothetical protein
VTILVEIAEEVNREDSIDADQDEVDQERIHYTGHCFDYALHYFSHRLHPIEETEYSKSPEQSDETEWSRHVQPNDVYDANRYNSEVEPVPKTRPEQAPPSTVQIHEQLNGKEDVEEHVDGVPNVFILVFLRINLFLNASDAEVYDNEPSNCHLTMRTFVKVFDNLLTRQYHGGIRLCFEYAGLFIA